MQIALDRLSFDVLSATIQRAGQWWLDEFLNLFPGQVADMLSGRGRPLLILGASAAVTFELRGRAAAQVESAAEGTGGNSAADIERFLLAQRLAPKDVEMGLRLPVESVFRRLVLLPPEARDAIGAVLARDLAIKTPFRPEDIYTDHVALTHADGNRIAAWQWVVRRKYVDQALSELGITADHIAFVTSAPEGADEPEPFIALQRQDSRNGWVRRVMLGLCGVGLALGLLAGGLRYWNQETALNRLDAQIAAVTGKAQQVRALADQLQERQTALLRLRTNRYEMPGLIDLWADISRLLPTNSYLTEFRMAEVAGKREQQITLQGFSSAATALVGIFDSSKLLHDAGLTSSIAFDAAEGRERFTLQAKVRGVQQARSGSR